MIADETQVDYTSLETLLARAAQSTDYELFPRLDLVIPEVRERWDQMLEVLLPTPLKFMINELPPRLNFTVEEVREFWEEIEEQDHFVTLQSLPVVEPETLAQLESWIATTFHDYMSDGYYGVRALSLVSKPYFSSAREIALALVRAATLIGIPRVIEHLREWFDFTPLAFTTKALVLGLELEKPLDLTQDIKLKTIGFNLGAISPDLPAYVKNQFGSVERIGLVNAVVISINQEMWHLDTLFTPESEEFEKDTEEEFLLEERDQLDAIYRALSLATDSALIPLYKWRDFGDLLAFNTGTLDPSIGPSIESSEQNLMQRVRAYLTPEQIGNAATLIPKLGMNNLSSLGLYQAVERWMKVKRLSLSSPELSLNNDNFIELRIVLESLFLDDNARDELAYRLALRGARLIGKDLQERKRIFRTLREAYAIGSEAVHKGEVKSKKKNRKILDDTLEIVRAEILDRLEAGRKRDWDDIALG